MPKSENLATVAPSVDLVERWRRNGHRSGILWLTGLSAAGKSTLSQRLQRILFDRGWQAVALDGDDVRTGLCTDLGFTPDDRVENIRRVGEVAGLLARSGSLVIAAFISPYRADRDRIRAMAGPLFHEIWLAADLAACEGRDPKGLYVKARSGIIPEFTGISAPYEPPVHPELMIDTGHQTVESSLDALLAYVEKAIRL